MSIVEEGNPFYVPICNHCRNYNSDGTCQAFGERIIPDEILVGDNDHSSPLPGQRNDLIYSKKRSKVQWEAWMDGGSTGFLSAEFEESEHPRDDIGQFTFKNGGGEKKPFDKAKFELPDYTELALPSTGKTKEQWAAMAGLPDDFDGTIRVWKNKDTTVSIGATGEGVYMRRIFYYKEKTAENEIFSIDYDSKYKGRGAEIFKNQVDALTKEGYKAITTSAVRSDLMNGYYTWARLGYEPDITKETEFSLSSINITAINRDINDFNSLYGTDVKTFRELMSTKTGQEYWKENGQDFDGVFDLTPGSVSQQTLKHYFDERSKK